MPFLGKLPGSVETVTAAAQPDITSLGTLTTLTVDSVAIDDTTIGHTSDTDLLTLTNGVLTVAGEVDATSLDISGDADIDGTLEADAITVDGTALNEYIADTVGAMVGSNTESGITVAYQDGDNTLDFTVGTLNQDTSGLAATATALATARTIGGVSFDGTANINLPGVNAAGNQATSGLAATATLAAGATALATARTIGGVSFDGTANINLPGVNAAGNQNTSGTAANLSGTPNISVGTIGSGNVTTTGYIRGPASFTIDPATHGDDTGTVVIAGNLQVDGTTTTINSTTVAIDDLNFSIATDAADSAAANGAGITIGGASATLLYTHATTSWDMNKPLNVTGNIGVSGTVDGIDIAARDAVLTSTTTTAGAALPKAGGTMSGDLTMGSNQIIFNNNSQAIQIKDAAGTASYVLYQDNADTLIVGNGTNVEKIRFDTGGNEGALSIDTSGNVGIGTASLGGGRRLTVAGGALAVTGQNLSHSASSMVLGQDSTALSQIRFYGANTSTAGILQFTGSSSDGSVSGERLRIGSAGQIGIGGANYGTDGQVLTSTGASSAPAWEDAGGGAYSAWLVKTTTFTASSGDQLIANHASTAFTITLPASPSAGDTVIVKNVAAGLITIGRNGSNINSAAEDATMPQGNAAQLVYVASAIGWTVI